MQSGDKAKKQQEDLEDYSAKKKAVTDYIASPKEVSDNSRDISVGEDLQKKLKKLRTKYEIKANREATEYTIEQAGNEPIAVLEPGAEMSSLEQRFSDIEKPQYTVGETGISHRNMNYLDKVGLLPFLEKTEGKFKWRKFSEKDMVYLDLLKDLKNAGLKSEDLQIAKRLFYDESEVDILGILLVGSMRNLKVAFSIGFKTKLTIGTQEDINALIEYSNSPVVVATLGTSYLKRLTEMLFNTESEIAVNKVLGIKPISEELTEQEKEIIGYLRDGGYKKITIELRSDEKYILQAVGNTWECNGKEITEKEVLDSIKDKPFASITLCKRDGKVVSYYQQDTIKIK